MVTLNDHALNYMARKGFRDIVLSIERVTS